MPTTLPPAKAVIKDVLGCVDAEDAVHLAFSAASGIPIKESTTETADDPANGVPLEGCGALFMHGGKLYKRNAPGGGIGEVASSAPPTVIGTATGALVAGRYYACAVKLDDGKVLVIGGANQSLPDPALDSCELYDPETGIWTTTGALNTGRYAASAIVLADGNVLVVGGLDAHPAEGGNPLASCELYDSTAGTWSSTGSMSTARHFSTSQPVLVRLNDDTVLVAGYGPGGSGTDGTEIYTPGTGTWASSGALNAARTGHTLTKLANGDVLISGGSDYTDTCERFSSGTWSVTGDMTVVRSLHSATLLTSGLVLAAGGVNGGGYLSSCELYDPDTETWTATGSMSVARQNQLAFLLSDNSVQIVLGDDGGSLIANGEVYDPTEGTWADTGDLVSTFTSRTATLIADDVIVIAGGATNENATELYGLYTDLGFVKIQTTQTITGAKNFTGGVQANGVSLVEPAGTVKMFAGTTLPAGYFWCNGATKSKLDYPALYAAIGHAYGGDGDPDFLLPDLRGRFPLGLNPTTVPYTGTTDDGRVIREVSTNGGEETVTLTENETPAHTHIVPFAGDGTGPISAVTTAGDTDVSAYAANVETDSFGDGNPHNNMPPFLCIPFIIKY